MAAVGDLLSPSAAAPLLGRDKSTVLKWLQAGEAAKGGDQRDFFDRVTRAKAEGLADRARELNLHSKGDWRASEVILRRVDPDNWGDAGKRASAAHERAIHEQDLRRATALADMAEAKAAIVAAAVKGEARGVVLTPVDLVELLPEALRVDFVAALREHGLTLMVLRDLAAELEEGLSEAEMMDATGLGAGGSMPDGD